MKRVFYIGKFRHAHSTENYVTYAFEQNGVQVIKQDFETAGSFGNLVGTISRANPDVVLFSKPQTGHERQLIGWCRSQGITTICWLWDLYFGYRRTDKLPHQFAADYVFTPDGGHDVQWTRSHINHRVLRQGIHEPEHKFFDPNYRYDVAFVGNIHVHPWRTRMVRWLKRTYGRRRFIHHTNTRGIALNRALAEARVIVGDSYPSPHYWSNRIYEIVGRGGFLLHPYTDGLAEEFRDGTHYVGFKRDFNDLRAKIEYYLRNDQEREAIRSEGWGRVGRHYTYRQRVESLIRRVRL